VLAGADLAGIVLAGVVTAQIQPIAVPSPGLVLLSTLPVWLVLFRLYGLYERDLRRVSLSLLDDLPALFHAVLAGTLLLWAYLHALSAEPGPGPGDALTFGGLALASVSIMRLLARRTFLRVRGPARVLLVGGTGLHQTLVRKMRDHPEYGLDPVGEITTSGESTASVPLFGRLGEVDLFDLAVEYRIDRVIVSARPLSDDAMMDLVGQCGAAAAKVSILPEHVDALGPSLEIDDIEGLTMLGLNPAVLGRTSRVLKRSLDLSGAAIGLILLSPLLAAAAVAIRLESPGPILFRQRRVGRRGREFTLLKLRTMIVGAEGLEPRLRERSADPDWLKLERDPRVTRTGRLLRRTSIDELPQLWNVLRGEMSLVGPRPLIGSEDERVSGWQRARLDLAPGITGMWQVMGRTAIPFREMLMLDCLYVTNWSLWLDVKLIVRTIPAVLTKRGAN
jgi:exopolysaccharide biosynthesis polyprenyl glycosylphosphotransferase